MMEPNHTRLCARAAIAAALALSSTPLLAQVAEAPPPAVPEPVLTFPTAPPPPPAQPTIVLPTELPETVPAQPEAAAPEPEPRPAARAERPAPRAAAPAPASVAAPDPEPVAPDENLAPLAPEPVVETAAPIAASEPAAVPAPDGNDTQFWVAVLAGLAAIALAIWGFIAIGRRRPADRKAALIIERPIVKQRQPVAKMRSHSPYAQELHASSRQLQSQWNAVK